MLLKTMAKAAVCAVFAFLLFSVSNAQSKKRAVKKLTSAGPKVTQIDTEGLKILLKPKGKPLLINFWATWCDPCREEFPDLVRMEAVYRGKVDFITISLDDLAEIDRDVPKFLSEIKATMPAYLLKTTDDDAAIALISSTWKGNLPLTIVYNSSGSVVYEKNGKFKYETVIAELDKVSGATAIPVGSLADVLEGRCHSDYTYFR